MRVTIKVDSATPQEVYDLTLAFQRTLGHPMPKQLQDKPIVTVAGTSMGWESPALYYPHAVALLDETRRISNDRANEGS